MANSKIIITFNADLDINQGIGFKTSNIGSSYLISQDFVWKNIRSGFGQVTQGTPVVGSDGERSAINFAQAFGLDWNSSGTQFTITRVVNVVTIETNFSNVIFSDFYSVNDVLELPQVSNTDVTASVLNTDEAINILEVNFRQASIDLCQKANVEVVTNVDIKDVITPVVASGVNDTSFDFDFLRGKNITILVEDDNGNQSNISVTTPSILSPDDFNIDINNTPGGTTIIATNTIAVGLEFEYSLDNSTWQTSNVFSGLIPGSYTLYIKDQLGCSTSKTFTASEYALLIPYFFISKANSIRFANRIDFGDAGNYKTDENTLSCEVDVELPWHEVQLFQSADVITTQFKSNYENHTAKVIRANGDEVSVPVVKKSNYIGNKDSRDARKYDLGGGKTGVYFTIGSIYNYDTGFPTGETHYLNGGLPLWAKSGGYVKVDTEWFLIEDVLFDESKNAEIMVISSSYSGADVSVIAGSLYNIFDYEIYEFTIDMVDYIDEVVQVSIIAEDDNFTTITLLSEDISIQVKHDFTKLIEYWNDDNNDVFYATGIKHKIRLPYHKREGDVDDSSDVHKTDTNAILLSSELYEIDKFKFEPVTKEIWRKLMIALSCKNVLIDGVGYVKDSDFDTEGPLEDTNLYVLTAKMVKTGNVFTSEISGSADFDSSSIEVPGLIDIGSGGFLKY